ncbi:MAG: HEAT repeat domain-containing protein [Spirochaetes bacterium]|nr:HEAT repeat domain-containing protein [Spirochaetota bacterium]
MIKPGIILYFFLILIQGCSGRYISEDNERKIVEALSQSYKSNSWETRKEAVSNLCFHYSPEVEDIVITALEDTHSAVKIEALKCLGIKRPLKAKRIIRRIAESEQDNNIRMYSIQSLAKYRDPTSAPVFAKGLNSEDWLIREESIKGILMIDDALIKRISVPYIIQALNDSRINVRLAALENLKIKNKIIYNELSAIINNDETYNKINLLNAAIKAINGYLLDKTTREKIISLLTHPNVDVRISSLGVLKKDKELLENELREEELQ